MAIPAPSCRLPRLGVSVIYRIIPTWDASGPHGGSALALRCRGAAVLRSPAVLRDHGMDGWIPACLPSRPANGDDDNEGDDDERRRRQVGKVACARAHIDTHNYDCSGSGSGNGSCVAPIPSSHGRHQPLDITITTTAAATTSSSRRRPPGAGMNRHGHGHGHGQGETRHPTRLSLDKRMRMRA